MTRFQFNGAAGTVTGSCHWLEKNQFELLIDCGMYQGEAEVTLHNQEPFSFQASRVDAGIITHAHLDHCGRLPKLIDQGYRGPLYMTPATADLMEISLRDLVKVNERSSSVSPELTIDTIEQVVRQVVTKEYHEPFTVGPYTAEFYDAGHILGSAMVLLKSSIAQESILMSGDLGNSPQEIIKATERVGSAHTVVMESTYGDRVHSGSKIADVLYQEIEAIVKTGGTLLIPAFSIQRSQELIHLIKHLKADDKVPSTLPVFLDSPMAIRVSKCFLSHQYLYNTEFAGHGLNGLTFPGLIMTMKSRESEAIRENEGPQIIIAGSGMMTGGRILAHAKYYLGDAANRIFFVGYQGEETLGREIAGGANKVTIDGLEVPVRAAVNQSDALSSHADQRQLLGWLAEIEGVQQVVLVHGEEGPRQALLEKMAEVMPQVKVFKPQLLDELSL